MPFRPNIATVKQIAASAIRQTMTALTGRNATTNA